MADKVAILHQGRIVRQGATEVLRSDVKQIVLGRESLAGLGETASVLHRCNEGHEVAIVVEGAHEVIERLEREGVAHRVIDLNFDEIFEAYVTGQDKEPTRKQQPKETLTPSH